MYVFGSGWEVRGLIGFGLYQSCRDRGSVRCVSVLRLRCCQREGSGMTVCVVSLHSCYCSP